MTAMTVPAMSAVMAASSAPTGTPRPNKKPTASGESCSSESQE